MLVCYSHAWIYSIFLLSHFLFRLGSILGFFILFILPSQLLPMVKDS